MGSWSLRGWLLVVSLLFAVLVVGGISLTTYVIVSDGMQAVALDTTERVAGATSTVVREAAADAARLAALQGLEGAEKDEEALRILESRLSDFLTRAQASGSELALWNGDGELLWNSGDAALDNHDPTAHEQVLSTGEPVRTSHGGGNLITGLVSSAQLRTIVVHSPVTLPNGEMGIFDATYPGRTEERVIDAIRIPMAILAVSAMLIMVVLMQTSMSWVLNLVNDLRRAADSIEAGRLDARLPETGENEISELARSINKLIERLGRRSEAQSRFVADASHELATPVAGIRGYTSILRAWGGEDPTVRAEAIDAIDRESRRMARLTSDLLNLLHADQGLRLKSERFDVNAVARDTIAATASRYLEKEIVFIGPGESPQVMVGDSDRLGDVLSILLDNAAKYTPEGGQVSLTTKRAREEVTIEVTDSGEGIPADDIPRIFDRFFRSDTARTSGEGGFGLGLSIAKSIVTSMNGRIEASSIIGKGTTFTIVVPRGRL